MQRVVKSIRESWSLLKASQPGERFRDRYYRRHRGSHLPFNLWSLINVLLGALVIVVGVAFMAIPGPGSLVALLGLALLSSELLPVARALDRAEVVLRKSGRELLEFWLAAPVAVRVAMVLMAGAVGIALLYGGYYVVFGG